MIKTPKDARDIHQPTNHSVVMSGTTGPAVTCAVPALSDGSSGRTVAPRSRTSTRTTSMRRAAADIMNAATARERWRRVTGPTTTRRVTGATRVRNERTGRTTAEIGNAIEGRTLRVRAHEPHRLRMTRMGI
uniref:Uncharacterized protein n=1 Tax=Cacopsylla melanoneura TaxID=428564 RepID=A0A8D8QKB7_9HEMI